jgi:anti-sigma factor RsiW
MTTPGEVPDETLNALVDQHLTAKAQREARLRLESDPRGAARAATWQRQSEALSAAFAPIANEPLPLAVLLKLQAMQPALRLNLTVLRNGSIFGLGLVCGLALGWVVFGSFGL